MAKGVIHTQQGVALTLAYSVYCSERLDTSSCLILGPPTHISAFILPFAVLTCGAGAHKVHLMRNLSMESIIKAIVHHKVTTDPKTSIIIMNRCHSCITGNIIVRHIIFQPTLVFGLPAMMLGIARAVGEGYDCSSLKTFVAAGTSVTPAFTAIMKRILPSAQIVPVSSQYKVKFYFTNSEECS